MTGKDGQNKVKNITFEGIEFKYGGWERPTIKGFTESDVSNGTTITFHKFDWTKYDISELAAGKYNVEISSDYVIYIS